MYVGICTRGIRVFLVIPPPFAGVVLCLGWKASEIFSAQVAAGSAPWLTHWISLAAWSPPSLLSFCSENPFKGLVCPVGFSEPVDLGAPENFWIFFFTFLSFVVLFVPYGLNVVQHFLVFLHYYLFKLFKCKNLCYIIVKSFLSIRRKWCYT